MSDALTTFVDTIKTYSLEFPRDKSDFVENHGLPPMNDIYNSLIGGSFLNAPPTQAVFVDAVMKAAFVAYDDFTGYEKELFARLMRVYPSFIRQHHLSIFFRQHVELFQTFESPSLDYNGIDFLVRDHYSKNFLAVHSTANTDRSATYATLKKAHRQTLPSELKSYDPPTRNGIAGRFNLHHFGPDMILTYLALSKPKFMFKDFSPAWQAIVLAAGCTP